MIVDLPITQDGSWFQFSIELERVTYGFEFRWNEREQCWYVALLDGQGTLLVSSRKVVIGPLFRRFRGVDGVMQTGDVYVLDTSGAGVDSGLEDLGRRVKLTYASDADLGV